ncbi:MAG: tetratricopeptide repeat protein [Elainellaceae cyanobacterium]
MKWKASVTRRGRSSLLGTLLGIGLLSHGLAIIPMALWVEVSAQAASASVAQGYTYLNRGWVDGAIEIFQRALRANPQSVNAQMGLAIAYRRAGRDADAFQAYQNVVALDSDNQLALYALGILGGYRPEWQTQGIEALTQLLRLDPNSAEARQQRALLYLYQGQFESAIADYSAVLQSGPSPEALAGAAQAYTYSGNHAQSVALFERYRATGATLSPSEAIAYGLALRETGQSAQSVAILEQALRNEPPQTSRRLQLQGALASAYAANGQVGQAAAVLAPLQSRGDTRLILARAYMDIARYSGDTAYEQAAAALYRNVLGDPANLTAGRAREAANALSGISGQQTVALGVYRQLAQQYPGDVEIQVRQALLEQQTQQISGEALAARLLELTASAQPSEQQTIARSLVQITSPDPALLPVYGRLAQSGVDEPFLYYRAAQILIAQGNYSAARDAIAVFASAQSSQVQSQPLDQLLLADIDRREGNLEASAQRYQSVVAQRPERQVLTGALQGLATVRAEQRQFDEAIALYDQIIALNPQDESKQLGRASLAYGSDQITEAEAEAVLAQWLSRHTASEAPPELFSLAGVLPASATREALYNQLLTVDSANIPVQIRRIQLVASRDPDAARAQVEQLIANNPDDLNAYFVRGQIAQDLGDLSDASSAYTAILERNPDNLGALLALGGVEFQRRRYDAAQRVYNQALDLDPGNPTARRSLAGLNAAQGRRLAALNQLEDLQSEQAAQGSADPEVAIEMQRIREGFLLQRGIEPPWERF